MAFPPKQNTPQPGQSQLPGSQPKPSDGQVDAYERVINGKVVKVSAYASKNTISTGAAMKSRLVPGRPRIMAKPGSYTSGRDLPYLKADARARSADPVE